MEDVEVLRRQSRKGSAATGESTISKTSRKDGCEGDDPVLFSDYGHEVVGTIAPVMIRNFSIKDSAEEFEAGGRDRRPSSVGLLPPLS